LQTSRSCKKNPSWGLIHSSKYSVIKNIYWAICLNHLLCVTIVDSITGLFVLVFMDASLHHYNMHFYCLKTVQLSLLFFR